MRHRSTLLFLAFFVAFLAHLSMPTIAEADSVTLNFEVEAGAMLVLPDSIIFPAVSPGNTVEQTTQVVVKANTGWSLEVQGSEVDTDEGEPISIYSQLQVKDFVDNWQSLTTVRHEVVSGAPPTPSEGTEVTVELRLVCDFGDAPGDYSTEIVFTLVPQV